MLENLRPPVGYRLDRAVGTTFTLDLITLLTAPLAFTFFDWEDAEGRPSADPLALLQAVRENAARIFLFCQAGEIQVPPVNQPLLAYLEESIIEVRAPRPRGLFHPKVWLLRYLGGDTQPVRYRFLCMSRNLSFSRSWDTALVLDGELKDRQLAIARNHPLGDFVRALPGMAHRGVSPGLRAAIETMQSEVRRVEFELPETFDGLQFWPMGHEGSAVWPFPAAPARSFLVMSPFLKPTFLNRLQKEHWVEHLVSRSESLADLKPSSLKEVAHCWSMSPASDLASFEGADEQVGSDEVGGGSPPLEELVGLHAKLFVMDDGWEAHVWTGSANATEAAFNLNVEFLVELVGKKRLCGIDALLGGPNGEEGLRSLLHSFDASGEGPELEDQVGLQLKKRLELAKTAILAADLTVEAIEEGEGSYVLLLGGGPLPSLGEGVSASVWPVTLAPGAARLLEGAEVQTRFEGMSANAITAFLAVHLRAKAGSKIEELRFVLLLPLLGAPMDRRERILRSLLTDPAQVMRLLLLLLSGEGLRVQDFAPKNGTGAGQDFALGRLGGHTLLEAMLRSLNRHPEALDQVADLIRDLQQTEEGRSLLPDGLEGIWKPIEEARRRMRSAPNRGVVPG